MSLSALKTLTQVGCKVNFYEPGQKVKNPKRTGTVLTFSSGGRFADVREELGSGKSKIWKSLPVALLSFRGDFEEVSTTSWRAQVTDVDVEGVAWLNCKATEL